MAEDQKEFKSQTPDQDVTKFEDRGEVVETFQALPAVVGPMEIMMQAVQRGMGKEKLEVLERMFEFDLKLKAQQAKEAYFKSMAQFHKNAPPVKKDKFNNAFQSRYASLENMLNTLRPCLSAQGLSPSFPTPEQDDTSMRCFCEITHELGHSEVFSIKAPIDVGPIGNNSGRKSRNDLQDIKSTFTYLKAATFEGALGFAGTEATKDDDGNGAGNKVEEYITEDQQKTITRRLKEIYGDDPSMFFQWIGCETVDTITDYAKAKKGLDGAEKAKAEKAKSEADKDESKLGE